MGSENQDQCKKCYCAKCFMPIEAEDKVDIEGQNFHRNCSMCCMCHIIPESIKMFYGQVFCNECFKNHILNRFKGECPNVQTNGWWLQWGPHGCSNYQEDKPQEQSEGDETEAPQGDSPSEPAKKCICIRCLQSVDEKNKIVIDGKNFHRQCARCCACHTVPTSLKIYYGQVFCEECFNRHVLSHNKDNPSEFFKTCFEQWNSNPQFASTMKEFMASGSNCPPVFVIPGPQSAYCRCGGSTQEWLPSEPKKSEATPSLVNSQAESVSIWGFTSEHSIRLLDFTESLKNIEEESANHVYIENPSLDAMGKIEKLTKFLQNGEVATSKLIKWRNFNEKPEGEGLVEQPTWVVVQARVGSSVHQRAGKCLWQCGPIYVTSDQLQ